MSGLNIVGVGSAYPETIVSNALINEINPQLDLSAFERRSGIRERRSSLPLEYIRQGNFDPQQARKVALQSPTHLAAEAARRAVKSAGIELSDIGLILGEASCPYQTCPGEAPRIANALRLKIPAYDLAASACTFLYHLDIVSSWQPARCPRFILSVTTNTPTHALSFHANSPEAACLRFGDAAFAMVLSYEQPGKMIVKDSLAVTDGSEDIALQIDTHGFIRLSEQVYMQQLTRHVRASAEHAIELGRLDRTNLRFIGPQFDSSLLAEITSSLSISVEDRWSCLARSGDCLGASPGLVLEENWARIAPHENILIALAGAGFSYGFVTLVGSEPGI